MQNEKSLKKQENHFDFQNESHSLTNLSGLAQFEETNFAKNTGWTKEEDNLLTYLVNVIGCKWKFISKYFRNKTLLNVYNRYRRINPDIKRGHFTPEEDFQIIEMVKTHGFKWSKLADIMKTRSSKQIRARFMFRLDKNYDFSDMNEDEKKIIFEYYPKFRNKWSKYNEVLDKKRSPNAIRKLIFGK